VAPTDAASFLLLDRLFPRSAIHAVGAAEECLTELDPRPGRLGWHDEARRVLGRLRAELEFLAVDDILADLNDHVGRIELGCADTHRAVSQRYFQETQAVEWSHR
jgi:uncharacterized alpha-E superfamily protein